MKPAVLNHEILVVTTATYPQKTMVGINMRRPFFAKAVKKAILKGLLEELFPELTLSAALHEKLLLWKISAQGSSLIVELTEVADAIEPMHSIDPYSALARQHMN
jgi:hypothetical protein